MWYCQLPSVRLDILGFSVECWRRYALEQFDFGPSSMPGVSLSRCHKTLPDERCGQALCRSALTPNCGGEEHCGPLRLARDSGRYSLLSLPVLARAVGRVIGGDQLWLGILNGDSQTSAVDVTAGLLARTAELAGDCCPVAAAELNAFLDRVGMEMGRHSRAISARGGTQCCSRDRP